MARFLGRGAPNNNEPPMKSLPLLALIILGLLFSRVAYKQGYKDGIGIMALSEKYVPVEPHRRPNLITNCGGCYDVPFQSLNP